MHSIGIVLFFTIALAAASFTSQSISGPHLVTAKSTSEMTKSLMGNITRFGVMATPIMCVSIGDIMKSLPSILNATSTGGNETNSTQGMMMNMMEMGMKSGMQNASQDQLQQGMMKSGMQNASQDQLQKLKILQHLKDFVFCSPANEKMMGSMMK
ncbi:MAG TPA: hypothetical protein VH796_18625 [Nitrososphaeraceae archaeon]|jgi:hypothetical protein